MKVIEEVVRIPHLDLNMPFDLDGLLDDLRVVRSFAPLVAYETDMGTELNQEWHREAWRGLSLVGYDHDCTEGMNIDPDTTGECQITDLGEKCPHILAAATAILGDPCLSRIRVMEILPGKSLPWHCHFTDIGQWPVKLTIQIPLIVPDGFEYVVTKDENVKRRAPPELYDETKAYRECYKPGRAYVFNSKHSHTVFNHSDQSRFTIMFYGNVFFNETFRGIVETAVEKYNGPLL